jgi:hypothetical protein
LPPSFTTRPTSGSASPRRPASRRNSFSPPGQACSLCLELESAWGQGCASYPSRVPKSDGRHCRCVSRFAQCLCAKLLSGFPPGGINDTYARLIGQWLSEHLGQQFIIENHPGVGGNLAAETVAKAEPDGYTLLLTTPADAWNATLYNNLNFNYARDFTPVATMSRGAGILVVNPVGTGQNVSEFIADAKAYPGKISMASAGIGSAPYMFWELFKSMSGIDLMHVPYHGGGPAVVDLLAGRVQSYFGTFASSIEHVRRGHLRALAVTSATRAAVLPDVPAVSPKSCPAAKRASMSASPRRAAPKAMSSPR